jgi:hypothetical protein
MNCTSYATERSTNDTCICYAPYYGIECEYVHTWWFNMQYALHSIEGVLLLLVLLYACVIFREKITTKKVVSLAGVALLIDIVSIILRIIWIVLPSVELVPYAPNHGPLYYIGGILVAMPMALWCVASALVIVYWYDGLRNSLTNAKPGVTRTTKISLIVISTILFMMSIIGLSLSISGITLGYLVYYIPVCVFILGIGIVTLLTKLISNVDGLAQHIVARNQWNLRMFMGICVLWVIFCAALGIYKYVPPLASIVNIIIFRGTEIGVSILIICTIDYRLHILRRTLSCNVKEEIPNTMACSTTSTIITVSVNTA